MAGSLALRLLGTAIITMFVGSSLAACDGESTTTSTSSGGDGGGGSGGGGSSASNGARYAQAFCDRTFDCCNTADLAQRLINSDIVDYAGCRIAYRTIWESAIEPVVSDGEKAGRVVFSHANFDACMKTIGDIACADLSTLSAVCKDVFTPKVAPGQECFTDVECIDGTCEFPNGAAAGKCEAKPTPVGLGGACTENEGCESGLYCEGMKCATLKADGETCGNKDECSSGDCIGTPQKKCAKICEGGGPGPGTIDKTLESIGGPLVIAQCDKAFDCCTGDEFDTLLFQGIRSKPQCLTFNGLFLGLALVKLHNGVVEGKLTVDGAAFQTCIDQYAALTCQDLSKGGSIDCPNAATGLLTDGTSCSENAQCVSKYCNEAMPDQGKCATIPGAAAPCTDKCVDGYYCDNGTCAPQKAVGGACTNKNECAGSRCYGANGMKTCALICDGI